MKHIAPILAFALVVTSGCGDATRPRVDTGSERLAADQQVATGAAGMVVSAHPLASKAGAKMLQMGGNAIDAAIAVQFALNVVEPQNSGIGGGGFMMVYEASTGKITVVDGRERANATATATMFLGTDGVTPIPFATRQTLGKAVGIPGTLRALAYAHATWGKLPFKQVIQPAIGLATEGVPVNFVLAADIQVQKGKLNDAAKAVFVPANQPLVEGDWLVQPDLAKTLQTIQHDGVEAFYDGALSDPMLAAIASRGGTMTRDDLRDYRVTLDAPVHGTWRGFDVAVTAPPSSGGVAALQILDMVERKNIASQGIESTTKYHQFAQAAQLAFADRAKYMGDPLYVSVPVEGLLDPAYLASRAALIQTNAILAPVTFGVPSDMTPWVAGTTAPNLDVGPFSSGEDEGHGDTTHFSVVDAAGNIVAWTSTIEQAFGTGIMVPGAGFMLNNELTDFSATPTGPNQAVPGKRPVSSMTPMILFKDGKPILTIGASGGVRIFSGITETLLHRFDYGLDLKSAIEEPRIFTNAVTTAAAPLVWSNGVPLAARTGLTNLGYFVSSTPAARGFIGVVQSIEIDPETGVYIGAADSGRQGSAIGVDHVPQ